MKMMFFCLLFSFQVSFAADYICNRNIKAQLSQTTKVSTYPLVSIDQTTLECDDGACQFYSEALVSKEKVCNEALDVQFDCKMSETLLFSGNYTLGLECSGGKKMKFIIDQDAEGKIECYKGQKRISIHPLGQCRI